MLAEDASYSRYKNYVDLANACFTWSEHQKSLHDAREPLCKLIDKIFYDE